MVNSVLQFCFRGKASKRLSNPQIAFLVLMAGVLLIYLDLNARLGRLIDIKGPGFILVIPVVEKIVLISLLIVTLDVPSQEVITKDNVTTNVNAVVYYPDGTCGIYCYCLKLRVFPCKSVQQRY